MSDRVKNLHDKIIKYYTDYYKGTLGIDDYEARIAVRLEEENVYAKLIDKYRTLVPFFNESCVGKKVFVDGAGTGGEIISFAQLGYTVFGIEPSEYACDIISDKLKIYDLQRAYVLRGVAEALPFHDNYFDFVWSWTVLEHVQDLEQAIHEIYRVLAPGGWAFLMMPDYRQFYEGHYKMYLPMFLPKFIVKCMLRLHNKPVGFLDWGINFTNARQVRNILQALPVMSMQLFHPWSDEWKWGRNIPMNIIYYISRYFGVQRDQVWIINKC